MNSYILTYPRLSRENTFHLSVLKRGEGTLISASTVSCCEGEKRGKGDRRRNSQHQSVVASNCCSSNSGGNSSDTA